MIDTLLVDRAPGETRVAAMSGETVIEVYHHRQGVPGAGALYRGRVGKRLPDASAVFVDIGLARPAFMPCGAEPPVEGGSVDVRIVQPPRGEKGAKVAKADLTVLASVLKTLSTEPMAPKCLKDAEHPLSICARQYRSTLKRILVTPNDADGHVRGLLSEETQVEIDSTPDDIFFELGVDEVLEQALRPEATFAGGGKLIIEPTAALVAIDVDAGPMAAADANRAAIDAVAREIRLRALAGPMIIDLIPTKGRDKLIDQLKAVVVADPVPTTVSGLTPEGRIELNRRRIRPSLADTLLDGTGRLSVEANAYQALRQVVRRVLADNSTSAILRCSEALASLYRGVLASAVEEAESRIKCSIALKVMADCAASDFDISQA